MKTFEEFLKHVRESNEHDYTREWEVARPRAIFVRDIDSYKLFLSKGNTYYLTKDNKYIGHLEFTLLSSSKIKIVSSNSKIRGFYKLLFPIILEKYNEVFSDNLLSESAIKAYLNLEKESVFIIKNYNSTLGYRDFDSTKLNSNEECVSIRLKG